LSNVKKHLKKNGYYISASFNKNTDYFKYVNNEWKTNIGTKLFLSSETELKKMFSQFFKIKEIKTLNLNEKYNNHLLTYLILTK
jgi:hypothetical protein